MLNGGLHPVGRIFPECAGLRLSGRREESLSGRPHSRCLKAIILCLDRHKCFARQTQVFYTSDTSVLAVRHKCLTMQEQAPDNQQGSNLKHKPSGEVIDLLLIPNSD